MISEDEYKELLGEYATTVTVVTTRVEDRMAGLTVSSFCSVSISPPLVLTCVEREAQTDELLQEGADFTVNVLREGQEEMSRKFAQSGFSIEDGLPDDAFSVPERGGPILVNSGAWMICRQYETCDGGDHIIYIGEVIDGKREGGAKPLLYYDAEYGSFQ